MKKKLEAISVDTRDYIIKRWLYYCNRVYVDSVINTRKLLNRIDFPDDFAKLHFWLAYKREKFNKSHCKFYYRLRDKRADDLYTIQVIISENQFYFKSISILPSELDGATDPAVCAALDEAWNN